VDAADLRVFEAVARIVPIVLGGLPAALAVALVIDFAAGARAPRWRR
jgi:hypothetical protein